MEYRLFDKLHHIQSILSGLKADEAFFSMDEFEIMRNRTVLHVAVLLGTLHVASLVEAKAMSLRWAFMDRKEADVTQAGVSDLCFVEIGKGKAKRRTPYILDFDGQCRAMDSAVHYKKKLRNHMSK